MDAKLETALLSTINEYHKAREEFRASYNPPHVALQHRMAMEYLNQVLQHFMNAEYIEYVDEHWRIKHKK